ncbi:MAG: terpene cyclase/mutase family protein [Planctomycetota bacterium]|nr:terpene cyclase/mutase family protein [Planctomycetota bacterium]
MKPLNNSIKPTDPDGTPSGSVRLGFQSATLARPRFRLMARHALLAASFALMALTFLAPTGPVRAAGPATPAASTAAEALLPDPREMARTEASVDRALEYLFRTQTPEGSWPSWTGSNNGINAYCLLAFLGRGHEPGRGPYKLVVDRAVRFLLAQQNEQGFFPDSMYCHGLTTLALIEAYGFIPTPQMRAAVQKAVDLIVKSQAPVGGWRYSPAPVDADLSVTVMQVVALRAAQNARLDVPKSTIERALAYVKLCASPAGGYCYQPGGGPSAAQTAAGSLSMALLGAYDDPSVGKALTYLQKQPYNQGLSNYFYYTTYYAMQANFQAGGDYWAQWHPKVRQFLLENQQEDGSWPGFGEQVHNGGVARCYSTALGAMVLEVYMHYLPAYQR